MGPKFWSRRLEPKFFRDFNDWELDMVGDLLHMLRGHRPSFGGRFSLLEARKKWSVQGQGSLLLVDQF